VDTEWVVNQPTADWAATSTWPQTQLLHSHEDRWKTQAWWINKRLKWIEIVVDWSEDKLPKKKWSKIKIKRYCEILKQSQPIRQHFSGAHFSKRAKLIPLLFRCLWSVNNWRREIRSSSFCKFSTQSCTKSVNLFVY
jgi:hypothetical protein